MFKKTVAIITMALLAVPAVGYAAAGNSKKSNGPEPVCVPLPVSTDAKDIHIGTTHIHVPGLKDIRGCVTANEKVSGTPTVTSYSNCGSACFAVRVADVNASADLKVELLYKEDGTQKSVAVDPDPVDVARDVEEVCISNHAAGTPDPCVVTLTSPSNLKAKGGSKQVALRWSAAGEAYGRQVSTTYEVWRSTTGELDSFEMIAEQVTDTSFLDTALARRTTYSYFVVAVDESGNRSGGSNVATATTN
ncbi:MAG: fibronectin type III domain-containing protein [Actinomycetota bacterium]|nr:fibronectin type III domain-containing protein [Actinomycetota bacterium]